MKIRQKINSIIDMQGFIEIDAFMRIVMSSEESSYYRSKDPIGQEGDFITAPEISQMFGEMIGIWAIDRWNKLGRPKKCNLVELGAGRGSLLRDLLRISRIEKEFFEALTIYIIDINEELIKVQKEALNGHKNIKWIPSLD